MKTLLLLLPWAGAALLAFGAEPVESETPSATVSLSATRTSGATVSSGGLDAADKAYTAKLGDRLARSGRLTTRTERSANQSMRQSLNPFTPSKPVPATPWLSRAAWSTVATAEHESVASPSATNRELKFKVVVWRD